MEITTPGAAAAPPGGSGTEPILQYHDFRVRQAQIRVFDRSDEPDSDDASDMYVLEVFGVSVLIRLRTPRAGGQPELYIHIDNESRPLTDLAVEVDNRGETRYRLWTRPDPTPALALHLAADDWEDVLDGLGAAAERTWADLDCATCPDDAACERHDDDWARVDRWRALAVELRQQLTTTHQPGKEPQ